MSIAVSFSGQLESSREKTVLMKKYPQLKCMFHQNKTHTVLSSTNGLMGTLILCQLKEVHITKYIYYNPEGMNTFQELVLTSPSLNVLHQN